MYAETEPSDQEANAGTCQVGFDGPAFLRDYGRRVSTLLEALPWEVVDRVVEALHQARLCRAHVFVCGNGGSAATAAHMVNDLNKGANAPGVPRFRAVGLADNVPLLMAWSNDRCYADALLEPLRNLARPGDMLVGFSCSGNSENVLRAVDYARRLGVFTVGLTGHPGGKLAALTDLSILVPGDCMEQVEDVHLLLEHAMIGALRERAQRDLLPSLLLASGRGATPQRPSVPRDLPPRPAILIDRDGVLNANRADHVKSWEELCLLPGVLEALHELARLGLPIVVVTNQAAINRGMVDFEVVESIHLRLMDMVVAHGGRIDAVVWCPHRPDEGCACRKPATGMLTYAAQSLNLDLSRSYLVGDAESDIAAGGAVGCRTALVRTGRGAEACERVKACWGEACRLVEDLGEAARWIMECEGKAR
ncbi:MAG: HAD-IIIA family hydrolase [Chloroflexi bacterium]|nr:HAD-IIIA family hydrolase [Chloroflexota bacterium]